jgi:DNA-binding transcriptional ArsR family regulator
VTSNKINNLTNDLTTSANIGYKSQYPDTGGNMKIAVHIPEEIATNSKHTRRKAQKAVCEAFGFDMPQPTKVPGKATVALLEALSVIGPCSVDDLVAHLGKKKGTVYQHVQKLLKSGEVKKYPGKVDGDKFIRLFGLV